MFKVGTKVKFKAAERPACYSRKPGTVVEVRGEIVVVEWTNRTGEHFNYQLEQVK